MLLKTNPFCNKFQGDYMQQIQTEDNGNEIIINYSNCEPYQIAFVEGGIYVAVEPFSSKYHSKFLPENYLFDLWLNSDNVVKTGADEYREQYSQYKIPMTLEELKKYYQREFGTH